MFDFFVSLTDKPSKNPFENISPDEFNAAVFEYRHRRINVFGLYRKNGWRPLVKDGYLFFVYGNIFRRDNLQNSSAKPDQSEISDDIMRDMNNVNKYKGNFILVLIDIKTESITVLNSQLGIKHAYYYNAEKEFCVSSNLNSIRSLCNEINYCTVLQCLLFTYPIDGNTLLKGVKYINPGEILEYRRTLQISSYYDIRNMFGKNTVKFDINEYICRFNKSVEQKYSFGDNVYASFTGGFDGRTVISSLLKSGKDFKTYSFGKKNGENTSVPQSVSERLKINYSPVYLDEDYEKSYLGNALKVIYYSDGLSFNERANYIYSFSELSKSTNCVLSGLIGGETLRPIHLRTDYMNQNYYDLFYANTAKDLSSMLSLKYPNELFGFRLNDYIDELKDTAGKKKNGITGLKNNYDYLFYLIDLMQGGFRMYYGTEIHFERYYCENLTPYYDLDLLEYLYSTDYVKIFENAFMHNRIFRWKGQKIYAWIIKANYPLLNKYDVDRGYPPGYLLNPMKLAAVPFLYSRRKRNRGKRPDFAEHKWSTYFLQDYLGKDYNAGFINDNVLKEKVKNYLNGNSGHDSALTRLVSLQTWLNM
ncbi:MAG: hypothetical protein MUE56_04295 [Ignavibacteria bacterium]|jgi:hypothetical protein|nr:hypothetical protein [Ignavibacteria bacterium]